MASDCVIQDSTNADDWRTWTVIDILMYQDATKHHYFDTEGWPALPANLSDVPAMKRWVRQANQVTMAVEIRILCDDGTIYG